MIAFDTLKGHIKNLGNAAVAFSGGVDSTLLAYAAHCALGDRMIAVTIKSAVFPKCEYDFCQKFLSENNIRHIYVPVDVFNIKGFCENPENRCYICKTEMMRAIRLAALDYGFDNIIEGSNIDDEGDYRPGMRAVAEQGILSPFRELKMTKSDIRRISESVGLETFNKPSFACLASRFAYGEEISDEKLKRLEKAENYLFEMGIGQLRVRICVDSARIEVEKKDFSHVLEHADEINDKLRSYGFKYVSLDLAGYETGSMNRAILM